MSFNIIPKPALSSTKNGSFEITSEIFIYSKPETKYLRSSISEWILQLFAHKMKLSDSMNADSSINLLLNPESPSVNEEGYVLEITKSAITVQSKTHEGLYHGIQSLKLILLDAKNKGVQEISCGIIQDSPRFSWRGFMLDTGRHFHPVSTIKKLLDIIALLKMNVFHWHLTEDQGWRIEIKKYPKLIEIGSKRKDSNTSSFFGEKYTGIPHEGYYTQEEIKEVVQYAVDRFITVIPEIELPGHSIAAIASYPELGCTGKQLEVATDRGVFSEIYCAGKESTFEFLQDVLDEVMELFPSDIIHIGGDEVPKKRWKECHYCQERIRQEGLRNEDELQVYFTNRIGKYLKSKGKRLMGWNEILGDTLEPSAICHWWIGKEEDKMVHLWRGRDMVFSNRFQTYLNLNYTIAPMRFFYNWDPVPSKLGLHLQQHILGVESPLWTEPIPTYEKLGKHVFPRLLAVAEIGWTKKEIKNYPDFEQRIPLVLRYLDMLDMPYSSISEANPDNWKRFLHPKDWLLHLGMHLYFLLKGY
ncbi:MAG: beta-N-acetylhexosaminidase [Promethearchaeota archaeon]